MAGVSASELLPAAVGIALNPPAVVAVILMLASSRKKAVAFVLGWMAGLLAVGAVVLLLGDAGEVAGSPSSIGFVIRLVLGGVLLVVAVRQWRRGASAKGAREEGAEQEMPKWMRSLAGFSAGKSFVAAALFAAANPKTLALNIAGVVIIVEAYAGVPRQSVALVLFVVVASLSVMAPLLYRVLAPRRAEPRLAAVQSWLIANNKAVTGTVLLLLGVMLLSAGAQGLLEQ